MPPAAAATMEPVEPQSLKKLSFKSLKRALDLFSPEHGHCTPSDPESKQIRISYKLNAEYGSVKDLSSNQGHDQVDNDAKSQGDKAPMSSALALPGSQDIRDPQISGDDNAIMPGPTLPPKALDVGSSGRSIGGALISVSGSAERNISTSALVERIPSKWPRPSWHAPWRNYRVMSGHLGWVRSIAFDPSNSWFCTGSADRTIKIWDVASGVLKLTLTGHIEQIRGLAVSQRHTYLFSAGDDKQVKCWDLEQNKVIRSYHGHLSGVYCLALHPTIDILLTGGRDSVCRVWDIRTKAMVCALSGHDNTVCSVFARPTDPQVVTGSHDTTIKFWDLVAGKTMSTLTHHKKSVRALALHPKEHTFTSGSADNIKKFSLPKGEFLHNMLSQQKSIINSMAVNDSGILATAGDNGSLWFWDWKSGHCFQQTQTIIQPVAIPLPQKLIAERFFLQKLISTPSPETLAPVLHLQQSTSSHANPPQHRHSSGSICDLTSSVQPQRLHPPLDLGSIIHPSLDLQCRIHPSCKNSLAPQFDSFLIHLRRYTCTFSLIFYDMASLEGCKLLNLSFVYTCILYCFFMKFRSSATGVYAIFYPV